MALDAHILELMALLESLMNRKKVKDPGDPNEPPDDDEENSLTGEIPWGPVGPEGLFSGTEDAIAVPEGKKQSPRRPGSISLLSVILGQASPAQYVASVGPVAAGRMAMEQLKLVAQIARRTGLPEANVRAAILAVLNLARQNGVF